MSVKPCRVGRDVKTLLSWSTVEHTCVQTSTPYTDDPLIHVVLAPRQLTSTRVTNLRDAGFDVVAYGVFPSEVPDCSVDDAFGTGEHLLVRPRDDSRR